MILLGATAAQADCLSIRDYDISLRPGASTGRLTAVSNPANMVQERLGHSSIVMTMDRYGHLFPRGDDSAELAAAERMLLGTA